jgi:hypothetical protein
VVVIKLEDEGFYKGVTKKGYGSKAWEQSSKSQNKKNQELEMQVFQVETIKFIVKTMVKRVSNVELFTTLSEKLKKEQQSHACMHNCMKGWQNTKN